MKIIIKGLWFLEVSSGSGDCHHWIHFKGSTGHKNKIVLSLHQKLCLFTVLDIKYSHSSVSSQVLWGGWHVVFRLLDLVGFIHSSRNVLIARSPVYHLVHLFCYFPSPFKPCWHQFSSAIFHFPVVFLKILNSIILLLSSKFTLLFAFSVMLPCCTEVPPE